MRAAGDLPESGMIRRHREITRIADRPRVGMGEYESARSDTQASPCQSPWGRRGATRGACGRSGRRRAAPSRPPSRPRHSVCSSGAGQPSIASKRISSSENPCRARHAVRPPVRGGAPRPPARSPLRWRPRRPMRRSPRSGSGSAAAIARNASRRRWCSASSSSSNRSATAPTPAWRLAARASPSATGRSRISVRSGRVRPTDTRSSAVQRRRRDAAGGALVGAGRIEETDRRGPTARPAAPGELLFPHGRRGQRRTAPLRPRRRGRAHGRRATPCESIRRVGVPPGSRVTTTVHASGAQPLGQTRDLGRFAGPLAAFEGHEPCRHGAGDIAAGGLPPAEAASSLKPPTARCSMSPLADVVGGIDLRLAQRPVVDRQLQRADLLPGLDRRAHRPLVDDAPLDAIAAAARQEHVDRVMRPPRPRRAARRRTPSACPSTSSLAKKLTRSNARKPQSISLRASSARSLTDLVPLMTMISRWPFCTAEPTRP